MRYGSFVRNDRVIFAEQETSFLYNLSLYLYFSQNARFCNVSFFEEQTLPDDLYNYQIDNNKLVRQKDINQNHIQAINKFNNDLKFISSQSQKLTKLCYETQGHYNLGFYLQKKIEKIAYKIVNDEKLTITEKQIFDYEKSKYSNTDDKNMAKMILTQLNLWESQLDKNLLTLIKNLDKNISGGF